MNRFVCCVILLTYCQTHAHTDMFYLNEQTVYAVYRVPASPHSGYIVGEAHRSSLLEGGQHALARAKQWIQEWVKELQECVAGNYLSRHPDVTQCSFVLACIQMGECKRKYNLRLEELQGGPPVWYALPQTVRSKVLQESFAVVKSGFGAHQVLSLEFWTLRIRKSATMARKVQ